jgi:hypothetical protein
MYYKGQSMHFSLYIPLLSYLLFLCYFGCRCLCKVLVVLKATLVSVSLNILAICCVSCPNYVDVIYLFCLRVFSFVCSRFVRVFCLIVV